MDELGRATSNEDGVSIAWAVAEYLMKKRSMTFFVTHYPQLNRLAEIYPCAQNISMDAKISGGDLGEIRYTYKIKSGACKYETDYGIKLASLCGWPSSIVADAANIEGQIAHLLPQDGPCQDDGSTSDPLAIYHALLNVQKALKDIANTERPPQSMNSFRQMLQDVKDSHIGKCDEQLIRQFECLLFREIDGATASEANSMPYNSAPADEDGGSRDTSSLSSSSLSSSSFSTSSSSEISAADD